MPFLCWRHIVIGRREVCGIMLTDKSGVIAKRWTRHGAFSNPEGWMLLIVIDGRHPWQNKRRSMVLHLQRNDLELHSLNNMKEWFTYAMCWISAIEWWCWPVSRLINISLAFFFVNSLGVSETELENRRGNVCGLVPPHPHATHLQVCSVTSCQCI